MDIGKEVGKSTKARKLRPGIPVEDQPQREPQETPIMVPDWPVREPAPANAVPEACREISSEA
jgi:hypothetical protein